MVNTTTIGAANAEADVQALIDAALTGATLDQRVKGLQALNSAEYAQSLQESHLEELSALLLANDELYLHYKTLVLACPYTALQALDTVRAEEVLQAKPRVLERIFQLLSAIGLAHRDLWQPCLTRLLQSMTDEENTAHDACFREICRLHGIQKQDPGFPYVTNSKFKEPTITPSEETVFQVREAYRNGLLTPEVSGGFIDFLEACGLPADPKDEVVQSLACNTWEGQYEGLPDDVLLELGLHPDFEESPEMREELHQERLEALREHWVQLHQKKRAQTLSRALSKAIAIFGVYFAIMWGYGYLISQQEQQQL
eukprot:m.96777 g.96777  ORF g.96777 m.96777 type:complete len:313 (-) comp14807_c0_seq2:1070-2008(-)